MPVVTDNEVLVRVRFTPNSPPMEVALSTLLDAVFGAAQGTICFRTVDVWRGLDPGLSNGLVLTSGGPHANVYWGPGGGFSTPTFSSFDIAGQATTLEVGTTISAGAKTFEWTTVNPSNVQLNSISIVDTTASVTLASGLADTGSDIISIGSITLNLPGSQVWTINGIDVNSVTFSLTFTVNWQWRVYAGVSGNVVLTANQIKALADSSGLQSSFPGTYNFSAGDYKYFSYPDSMGSVSNFIDANTGFPISMATAVDDAAYSNTANGWSYALVSVTNAHSIATNYRVYRSQYPLGGTLSVRIT